MIMKRIITIITLTILFTVSIFLIFYWFNWKLFVVLLLWGWAMNFENKTRRDINDNKNKI